jgi:7-cyano-7-deazaguanine synthase
MDAILLSGGMDSIALAAWLRPNMSITIDYGQRSAAAEIVAAEHVSSLLTISHHVVRIDCSSIGSGDLSGTAPIQGAPASDWWPFRNQLLITLAAMYGIRFGVTRLLIGTVRSDCFHTDGTEAFVSAITKTLQLQEGQMSIAAPAVTMSSAELIRASGIDLSVLGWAHSCHVGDFACGSCRGCNKHREVMEALGHEAY